MKAHRLLPPALLILTVCLFGQGDLTPPGPPAPTMKSLDQVEARIPIQSLTGDGNNQYLIGKSGSYYLTGNISGTSGKSCIGIVASVSNVTIDLNGFSLDGGSKAVSGIACPGGADLAISNGNIHHFLNAGIDVRTVFGTHLDNVRLNACAGGGAYLGASSIVTRCSFQACGAHSLPSLWVLNESLIDRCTVSGNTGSDGIWADYSSIVSHCTSSENFGTGIVATGASVRIEGDHCMGNALNGIEGKDYCEIVDCTCSSNGAGASAAVAAGIHLSTKSGRVDHCSCCNNYGRGIAADTGSGSNVITRNSAVNNTTNNYEIIAGNRPAIIVTYSSATGYTCGDPLANTQ